MARLRKLQLESMVNATFGGWTAQQEADHHERAERLAYLLLELAPLDGKMAS